MVVFLILERLSTDWIIADNFAALCFVLLNFRKSDNFRTVRALYTEAVDNLLHNTLGTSDLDVQMAHWTFFVHHEPIFDAQLAE